MTRPLQDLVTMITTQTQTSSTQLASATAASASPRDFSLVPTRHPWTEAAVCLPLSSLDTQQGHSQHKQGGNSLYSKEPDSCPHSNPRILESARPGSGVKLKHKVTRNTPGPRAIARGHYTACNHTVHWNSILPQNCILTKLSPDTTHCSVTTV